MHERRTLVVAASRDQARLWTMQQGERNVRVLNTSMSSVPTDGLVADRIVVLDGALSRGAYADDARRILDVVLAKRSWTWEDVEHGHT